MSLQLSNYPSTYGTTPLPAAYAWIDKLEVNFQSNSGSVGVVINLDVAAANAGKPPISSGSIQLGASYSEGEEAVTFPTLEQILVDNAEAFGSIRAYLYNKIKLLPQFAGSTEVP